MKHAWLAALCYFSATMSQAVEFDPRAYGFVEGAVDNKPAIYCEFYKASFEPNNYYRCSDGSLRYGSVNLWAKPSVDDVPLPFDQNIKIPGLTLLTIDTVLVSINGGVKSYESRIYRRLSFSYLLLPSKEICEQVAPKLVLKQYIKVTKFFNNVSINYTCE